MFLLNITHGSYNNTHTQTQSSKARGGFGQERYEKEEMQKLVKEFSSDEGRGLIIDAKQSIAF